MIYIVAVVAGLLGAVVWDFFKNGGAVTAAIFAARGCCWVVVALVLAVLAFTVWLAIFG